MDFFRLPFVVANNFVATNKTAMVFDDGRVLEYDRRVPRSQQGAFAASILLELFGLGHEIHDMAFMGTRMSPSTSPRPASAASRSTRR